MGSSCGAQQAAEPDMSMPDSAVTLYPYFKVNEGKMEDFKANFKAFAEAMKPEEEKPLYYGWAIDAENRMVHCREAYVNAEGLLAHLKNVDAPFKTALSLAALDRLYVSGPAQELEKVKDTLAPLGTKFFYTDVGAKTHAFVTPTSWTASKPDTSCALYPYWGVKNMGAFEASLEYFSVCMRPQQENALWWGFVTDKYNSKALCRESYKNGGGVLTHLANCKKPLDAALGLADIDLLEFHGPAAEIAVVKETLSGFGCKFFVLQEGAQTWCQ